MRKYLFIMLVLHLAWSHVQAQNYTLASTSQMAPGIIYRNYTMTTPHSQQIHILEVDLKDPAVKLQSAKAGNIINGGVATVKQIAASKDVNENYHNVIGAVNGDFFVPTVGSPSEGNVENILVGDGQIFAYKTGINKTIFGIAEDNNPFIDRRDQSYTVTRGGVVRTIQKINGSRTVDTLVLYNQFKGTSTGTDNTGTEVRLTLVPGYSWKTNAPVKCLVQAKQTGVANMTFSAGQAVLSGKGTESTFLQTFIVGDTVTLNLNIASGVSNIVQVTGGFPRIVNNGVNTVNTDLYDEGGALDQDTTHHPHTALGLSQDERFLYMVVVDGRTTGRHGMTLNELADLMVYLGSYRAVNLDGGASSTLVANNVVKNFPSAAGVERNVGSALLAYSSTRLMDGFEVNEGHFDKAPTYTLGTQYTVGVRSTSTMDRVTTNACSGVGSERVVLIDSTSISTPWTVRLLSGSGLPANNDTILSTGTLSFWLKTNTAQSGATVQVWFDDSDGAEASPALTILNDGEWHQYNFDLDNFNGSTITTGNGQLDAANITLDAIVLKQPNTATSWTVYFDDVLHDKNGSGTSVKSQNKVLDDFEINVGHFDQKPTNTAGTQYTVGISTSSTLQRVTSATHQHRGVGGLRAVLIDSAGSSTNWTVRLMSGSGMPSNNFKITSDGTLSFWMKTNTAQANATVQVWFDDSDGAEASPTLSVINDGQWHLYNFNLDNFNGTTITSGNGQLDGSLITLDAIVLKQSNTSSTWTVYFDDVMHLATGTNPGTVVNRVLIPMQTIPAPYEIKNILLFPIPASQSFTLNLPSTPLGVYQVKLIHINGATVFANKYGEGSHLIDCSNLPAGSYIVAILSGKEYTNRKLIIQ
jgi:exopolysaccharide biosynthesis protein